MSHAFDMLLSAFSREDGISNVAWFDPVEAGMGAKLPVDYKAFLLWSNGGETLDPLPRLRFYSLAELLPRRSDGQPPDTVEVATDDSDGYGFDLLVNRSGASYPVVRYPLGDTTRDELELAGTDFRTFLRWFVDPTSRYARGQGE
jgi:hypothetical protein